MAKYFKLLIAVIILLVTGCGGNEAKVVKTKVNKVEQVSLDEITMMIDQNGSSVIVDENKGASNNNDSIDNSDLETNKNQAQDKSESNFKAENQNNQADNTANDTDNQMIKITISIDCKNILANIKDLENGYERFVPDDGVILAAKTYKVKKGTTVIDVLKMAANENEVNLVTQSSAFGLYIKSIGFLEEKVCGSSSGWLYKVNGKVPSKAASFYKLSEGDKIEWRYTCQQGDV